MIATPAGLHLYRAVTTALVPFAGLMLSWRARAGKEDPARLGERFGRASASRPTGPLVWLHGASVGETRVLLSLQARLRDMRPDLAFLFTSGTRTSAGLLANAPHGALHQYVPIDSVSAAQRFIAHWRPDLGVFAEGEIWPNLIETAAAAHTPLALVNARMSEKSLRRWRNSPAFAQRIFGRFAAILAADTRTRDGLSEILGKQIPAPGNLKSAAPPPSVDPGLAAQLREAIGSRPVWLAASTHPGEDEIALAAHARLRTRHAGALLVIAPRHPERGAAIAQLAGDAPRRANGRWPDASPVYIADSMGELAAFYATAPVALVGGSLLPQLRGHNPVEPAHLGCDIICGPHVDSFADVYADLRSAGALVEVTDASGLATAVAHSWTDRTAAGARGMRARALLTDGAGAMTATLEALSPLLPRGAHATA